MAKKVKHQIHRYTSTGILERCRKAEKGLPCKRHYIIKPQHLEIAVKTTRKVVNISKTAVTASLIISSFIISVTAFNPITYTIFAATLIAYTSSKLSSYLNKRRNDYHEKELTFISQQLQDNLITEESATQLKTTAETLNIKRGKIARHVKAASYVASGLAATAAAPFAAAIGGGILGAATAIASITATQGVSMLSYSYASRNDNLYKETTQNSLERKITNYVKTVRNWTVKGVQQTFNLNRQQAEQLTPLIEEQILETGQKLAERN